MDRVEKTRRTVHIGNISLDTDENVFFEYFKSFGNITNVRLVREAQFRTQYGFVEFENENMAKQTLNFKDHHLKGQNIRVTRAKTCIKKNYRRLPPNSGDQRSGGDRDRDRGGDRRRFDRGHHGGGGRDHREMGGGRDYRDAGGSDRMGKEERTVYLSNISPSATQDEIIDFCRESGDITNYQLNGFTTHSNAQPKYALIEFIDSQGAQNCTRRTGTVIRGVPMQITISGVLIHSRPPRGQLSDQQRELVRRTVHVSGVHVNATKMQLYRFFSKCGHVEDVRIAGDAKGKFDTRYAFVQFRDIESANKACKDMSGQKIGTFNKPIHVTYAREPIGHKCFTKKNSPRILRQQVPTTGAPPPPPGRGGGFQSQPSMMGRPPGGMMGRPNPGMGRSPRSMPSGSRPGSGMMKSSEISAKSLGYSVDNYNMYRTNYVFKPVYNFSMLEEDIEVKERKVITNINILGGGGDNEGDESSDTGILGKRKRDEDEEEIEGEGESKEEIEKEIESTQPPKKKLKVDEES